MTEVDIIDTISKTKIEFKMSPDLWQDETINLPTTTFYEKKFLNETGSSLHVNMDELPATSGGLYFFYIRPGILPNTDYLVYIGRAQFTKNQNLKKRCRSYFQKYPKERPKINRMIREWGPYLHIRYIELTDNELITSLEAKLINSLLPPFNDEIPNKTIKRAIKAFQ